MSATGFDIAAAEHTIAEALIGPGGAGLVITVLGGLPGTGHARPRRSLFRSEPERLLIGSWRYEVAADGRLRAAHVVNDVVLAETVLGVDAAPPHLVRSLGEIVASYGSGVVPNIEAALEVLATVSRP